MKKNKRKDQKTNNTQKLSKFLLVMKPIIELIIKVIEISFQQ